MLPASFDPLRPLPPPDHHSKPRLTLCVRRRSRLLTAACAAALALGGASRAPGASPPASGSVKFDGSFGRNDALSGPHFLIPAEAGRQRGGNLFHSFSSLDLAKDEIASFQAPLDASAPTVTNILARVTDGSPSSIDGTLRSEMNGANLFLINPAGVLFGANAQLDLTGSFSVTTADYVSLADGARFEAQPGNRDLTLSAAPISAFGFLRASPAPILFDHSQLRVPAGKGLQVMGGAVALVGASLKAPSGVLTLMSAASAGEVPFALGSPGVGLTKGAPKTLGAISLSEGSLASIDGAGGGKVTLRGGQLVMDRSTISSVNSGARRGGDLDVRMDRDLSVLQGSSIASSAHGAGQGGNVIVQSGGRLTVSGLDGATQSSILALAEAGTGAAGNVVVSTPEALISDNGYISTSTFTAAKSGDLFIHAGNLTIDGSTATEQNTGITASAQLGSTGDAGTLYLTVDQLLSIQGGGLIFGGTIGSGRGGDMVIHTGNLLVDASAKPELFAGILASATPDSTGDAGDLHLTVDHILFLRAGGLISGDTFGSGKGASLRIQAANLLIDGSAAVDGQFTGISVSAQPDSTGDAGSLKLAVDQLLYIGGSGLISNSTLASGNAGNLNIHARNLTVDGSATPDKATGIAASAGAGSTGNAGRLRLTVDRLLSVLGSGEISATTFSSGRGGDMIIQAGNLLVDGTATPDRGTGLSASANPGSTGPAGSLRLNVDGVILVRGAAEISSATFGKGDGGNLVIHAQRLAIDGSATPDQGTGISVSALAGSTGDAGRLKLTVDGMLSIEGGGLILNSTFGPGHAGNLDIHVGRLAIDGSALPEKTTGIAASAEPGSTGRAGNLQLTVDRLLSITGSGSISGETSGPGRGGDLSIQAGRLTIDGSTTPSKGTGISASANTGSTGDAGTLRINVAGLLALRSNGLIFNSTISSGNAGDLSIHAGNLIIDGSAVPEGLTGIVARAEPGSTGHAGSLQVSVDEHLNMGGGGQITGITFSSGRGGDLNIQAHDLTIDGSATPGQGTGIAASAVAGATGDAGSVHLSISGLLELKGQGIIASATFGPGKGGDLSIEAGRLTIDGSATPGLDTGIFASAEEGATGAAGSVAIHAGQVLLSHGGQVSVSATGASGGDIQVRADTTLELTDGSSINASAAGTGGNIFLEARDLFYLDHSRVVATAGTFVAPGTQASRPGAGGNISIDPTFIILDHGLISANAALGRGGNIFLEADYFFSSESAITATGSTAGSVQIAAPELDLAGSLVTLPGSLLDVSTQLREQCARRMGMDFSSFLVLGRGGVAISPEEAPASAARPLRKPKSGKAGR